MAIPTNPQELLTKLVAFDTTSSKSNLKLIDFVEAYLKDQGIASTRIPSPDGNKAALFAIVGPDGKNGIGLSCHSDCVPVEGQNWASDPFTLTLRDNKLYGRGSCDMKGFLACVLASVPLFKSRKLNEPIHIIVSYDEEIGCTGVRPLIKMLGKELAKPKAIIVGEPSDMTTIDAHKRIDSYLTVVTGREAHAAAWRQRHRHRGEADPRAGASRRQPFAGQRRPLRSAIRHDADGYHQRRHGRQYRA